MSDEIPRRSKPKNAPPAPRGYRTSRRSSKAAKSAKRVERIDQVTQSASRFAKTIRDIGYYLALLVAGLLVATLVLVLAASAVNGVARWTLLRRAERSGSLAEMERRSKDNLLVIGEQDGNAVGFLALRLDTKEKQVFGIAIPDGAFIEVPGQGFERVGESYAAGPDVSLSAISNYLTVPFHTYVIVSADAYSEAVKTQDVSKMVSPSDKSNASADDLRTLSSQLGAISQKSTAIVPLPVKPIKLGNQTYFEPHRHRKVASGP